MPLALPLPTLPVLARPDEPRATITRITEVDPGRELANLCESANQTLRKAQACISRGDVMGRRLAVARVARILIHDLESAIESLASETPDLQARRMELLGRLELANQAARGNDLTDIGAELLRLKQDVIDAPRAARAACATT